MNIIFSAYAFVVFYIDDIVVYSYEMAIHLEHVKTTIEALTNHAFKLNLKKCQFGQTCINFLGHVVDANGVCVNPSKLTNCENWPVPATGKELLHFLRVVNYWRDNIPLLSSLTAPLDAPRSVKDLAPVWTPVLQDTYDTLLKVLRSGVYLHHANFDHPFEGASDASGTGIGGCVYQVINGETRYVCFYSRLLSPSERNYSATKRELLALIFTIRKGHTYFWGRHFNFYTDHAALTYIRTQTKLNAMILNWFDELIDYDVTIHHRPGVLNILPDHLSRLYPAENKQYFHLVSRVLK